jgi:oligopeptide/dipeptide ABC transporter ATP-binding protein
MYAGRPVERATVESIFARSAHPYTQGLMASLPNSVHDRLIPIPGSPPNMLHPPAGCAFAARCSHAIDLCRVGAPPELALVGTSETACIRANDLLAEGASRV